VGNVEREVDPVALEASADDPCATAKIQLVSIYEAASERIAVMALLAAYDLGLRWEGCAMT